MRPTYVVFVAVVAVLATAPVAQASFAAEDLFVPAVGRGEGSQGSQWYTTLWLYNPNPGAVDVTVSLLVRGQPNPTPEQQQVTLPPGWTMIFRDVLSELFGLDAAVGAVRIQSPSPVVAGARVYNQPGDTVRESQGQLMPGLSGRLAIDLGESTDVVGIVQPPDGSFRSNFGLVETEGAAVSVEVTLYDGGGDMVATEVYTLGPFEAVQSSLDALGSGIGNGVDVGRIEATVIGGGGAVLAYGSAVANGTSSQDPTTLEMTFEMPAGGEGDITSVAAGPGLAGGGDAGDVILEVDPGDGLTVDQDGVSIRPGGLRSEHVASGEMVLGVEVDGEILRDVVTFEAGDGVTLDTDDTTVTISAESASGWERLETVLEENVTATTAGTWSVGADELRLPGEGRWRVGYRVAVAIENLGVQTLADPVSVGLVAGQELLRSSLSVAGVAVNITPPSNRAYLTMSGEAVVEVDRATDLAIAGRTASSSLRLTILRHDADISSGLAAPDVTSFLWVERLPE